MAGTEYIVLKLDKTDDAHVYNIADGKLEASGPEQAIRKTAERLGEGTYVATPLRSWTQHEVKVEATVKVTLS